VFTTSLTTGNSLLVENVENPVVSDVVNTCGPGDYLDHRGICQPCLPNCKTCETLNACDECDELYELDSDKMCILSDAQSNFTVHNIFLVMISIFFVLIK
jgi:hypothetical protein